MYKKVDEVLFVFFQSWTITQGLKKNNSTELTLNAL